VDNEQFAWREQAGDLPNHIGKRAHMEIVDDGDGWIAIDEIRFADPGWKPPDEPSGLASKVLGDSKIESHEDLAQAYGKFWQNAVERWKANSADRAETELVEWAVETGLAFSDQETADSIQAEYKTKAAALNDLAAKVPAPMRVLAAADGDGFDDRIHIRGNHRTLGDLVPRRFLEAIAGADQPDISATAGSGRLELARRVTGRENPLFARVAVNRVWHHLFGRGIVSSTDNFGVLGERPTHPELLDYLAQQFIEDGYSLKRLTRTIVLSRTYQMASRGDASTSDKDPSNRLFHRNNVRRLEGEAIRDAMLAVSGRLDETTHGAPVKVHLSEFMVGLGRPNESGPLDGAGRRSVYLEVRRNFPPPMLVAFDTPTPLGTVGRRNVSNVPAQALMLMNDAFVSEQAERWADRLSKETQGSVETKISAAYQQAFSRAPSDAEVATSREFLRKQETEYGDKSDDREFSQQAWRDLCQALLNAKEFVFVY
jgi:hypothetical protein